MRNPCNVFVLCSVLRVLLYLFIRKKIEKIEKKANLNFLAGELCAPEQSCRIASRVLSRMSNVQYESPAWQKFNDVLFSEIAHEAEQDRWFLDGTAVEVSFFYVGFTGCRRIALWTNHICCFCLRLVSHPCLVIKEVESSCTKASEQDVYGKVIGVKNGVEFMRNAYPFMHRLRSFLAWKSH